MSFHSNFIRPMWRRDGNAAFGGETDFSDHVEYSHPEYLESQELQDTRARLSVINLQLREPLPSRDEDTTICETDEGDSQFDDADEDAPSTQVVDDITPVPVVPPGSVVPFEVNDKYKIGRFLHIADQIIGEAEDGSQAEHYFTHEHFDYEKIVETCIINVHSEGMAQCPYEGKFRTGWMTDEEVIRVHFKRVKECLRTQAGYCFIGLGNSIYAQALLSLTFSPIVRLEFLLTSPLVERLYRENLLVPSFSLLRRVRDGPPVYHLQPHTMPIHGQLRMKYIMEGLPSNYITMISGVCVGARRALPEDIYRFKGFPEMERQRVMNDERWQVHWHMVKNMVRSGFGYCYVTLGSDDAAQQLLASLYKPKVFVRDFFAADRVSRLQVEGRLYETFGLLMNSDGTMHLVPNGSYNTLEFIKAARGLSHSANYHAVSGRLLGVSRATAEQSGFWVSLSAALIMSVIAVFFPGTAEAMRKAVHTEQEFVDVEASGDSEKPKASVNAVGNYSNPYAKLRFENGPRLAAEAAAADLTDQSSSKTCVKGSTKVLPKEYHPKRQHVTATEKYFRRVRSEMLHSCNNMANTLAVTGNSIGVIPPEFLSYQQRLEVINRRNTEFRPIEASVARNVLRVTDMATNVIDLAASPTYDLLSFVCRWVTVAINVKDVTTGLWMNAAMDFVGVLARLYRSTPSRTRDPVWSLISNMIGVSSDILFENNSGDDEEQTASWLMKLHETFRDWVKASDAGKQTASALFSVICTSPMITMGYGTDEVKDQIITMKESFQVMPTIERLLDSALDACALLIKTLGYPSLAEKIRVFSRPDGVEVLYARVAEKHKDLISGRTMDVTGVLIAVEKAATAYRTRIKKPMLTSQERSHCANRLKILADYRNELNSLMASFKERFATILSLFYGESQIGKTTLVEFLMDLFSQELELARTVAQILDGIWDDGILPLHNFGFYDDANSIMKDDYEPPPQKIRRLFNVANQPLIMSEADKKGVVHHQMKLAFITQNKPGFSTKGVTNPEAAYKRINFAFRCLPNHETGEKVGDKFLPRDRHTRNKPYPNQIIFQEVSMDWSDSNTCEITDIGVPMTLEEFLPQYVARVKNLYAEHMTKFRAASIPSHVCQHMQYAVDCLLCHTAEITVLEQESLQITSLVAGAHLGINYLKSIQGTPLETLAMASHDNRVMLATWPTLFLVLNALCSTCLENFVWCVIALMFPMMVVYTHPFRMMEHMTRKQWLQARDTLSANKNLIIGGVSAAVLVAGIKQMRKKVIPGLKFEDNLSSFKQQAPPDEPVQDERTGKEVYSRVKEERIQNRPLLPWITAERHVGTPGPAGQGATMQAAMNNIRKRAWSILVDGAEEGQMIHWQTGVMYMPTHVFRALRKHPRVSVTRKLVAEEEEKDTRVVERNLEFDWNNHAMLPDKDACWVRCVRGLPPMPSLTPWLLTSKPNCELDGTLVNGLHSRSVQLQWNTETICVQGVQCVLEQAEGDNFNSYGGLSGSCYFSNQHKSIAGFHTAGLKGKKLWFTNVTPEEATMCVSKLKNLPPEHQVKSNFFSMPTPPGENSPNAVHNHLTGNCLVTLEQFTKRQNKGASNLIANPWWPEICKALNIERSINFVKPNFGHATMVTRGIMIASNSEIVGPLLTIAQAVLGDMLARMHKRAVRMPHQKSHPVDVMVAIHGEPGHPHHNGMKLGKSGGAFYNRAKLNMLTGDHEAQGVLKAPVAADFCNMTIDLVDGKVSGTVGNLLFKDEPLSISKVIDALNSAPPRGFVGDNMLFYIICSMILEPILGFMFDNPDAFEHSLGIDPLGSEWEMRCRRFDQTRSHQRLPLDHGKYDMSQDQIVNHINSLFFAEVGKHLGYPPVYYDLVYRLVYECGCRSINYNGVVATAMHFWQSGSKITAMGGSQRNRIYNRCVIKTLRPNVDYDEEIVLDTLGDDQDLGIKLDSDLEITPPEIVGEYRNIGMTVTPETKTGEAAFVNGKNVVFLKRTTLFNEDLGYRVGALDMSSVNRPWELTESDPNMKAKMRQLLRSASREMVAYGRPAHKKYMDDITPVFVANQIPIDDDLDYDSQVASIMDANSKRVIRNFNQDEIKFECGDNLSHYPIPEGLQFEFQGPTHDPGPVWQWISIFTKLAFLVIWIKLHVSPGYFTVDLSSLDFTTVVLLLWTCTFFVAWHLTTLCFTSWTLLGVFGCTSGKVPQWGEFVTFGRLKKKKVKMRHLMFESGTLEVDSGEVEKVENVQSEAPNVEEEHVVFSDGTVLTNTSPLHHLPPMVDRQTLVAREALPLDTFIRRVYYPALDLFNNPAIKNRLQYHHAGSFGIKISIRVNATRFHSGRIRVHYLHRHDELDTYGESNLGFRFRSVLSSSRHHVDFEVADDSGAEMTIPWFEPRGKIYFSQLEMRNYVRLVVESMAPIRHGDVTADEPVITIYASFVNMNVLGNAGLEFEGRQVPNEGHASPSVVLGHIEDAARVMGNVPPLAVASEMIAGGAGALGGLLRLFGFSRPMHMQGEPYIPMPTSGFANTNLAHAGSVLAFDHQHGVTLDSRIGSDNFDIMSYKHFSNIPTAFYFRSVNANTSTTEVLFSLPVTPMMAVKNAGLVMPLNCAIPAMLHKFWHCTMKYKVVITCPITVGGRFRFLWDAGSGAGASHTINQTYLLDLRVSHELVIDIPMGQPDNFLRVGPFTDFNDSWTPDCHNGTLLCFVEAPLIGLEEGMSVDMRVDVWCPEFLYGDPDYTISETHNLVNYVDNRELEVDTSQFWYDNTSPGGERTIPPTDSGPSPPTAPPVLPPSTSFPQTNAPTPGLGQESTDVPSSTVTSVPTRSPTSAPTLRPSLAPTVVPLTGQPVTAAPSTVTLRRVSLPIEFWGTNGQGVVQLDNTVRHGGQDFGFNVLSYLNDVVVDTTSPMETTTSWDVDGTGPYLVTGSGFYVQYNYIQTTSPTVTSSIEVNIPTTHVPRVYEPADMLNTFLQGSTTRDVNGFTGVAFDQGIIQIPVPALNYMGINNRFLGIVFQGTIEVEQIDPVFTSQDTYSSNAVRSFAFMLNPGPTNVIIKAVSATTIFSVGVFDEPGFENNTTEDDTARLTIDNGQLDHSHLMRTHVGEWNHSLRTHVKVPMLRQVHDFSSVLAKQRYMYHRHTRELSPMNLVFEMYGGYRGGIVSSLEAGTGIDRLYLTRGTESGDLLDSPNLNWRGREIVVPSVNPVFTTHIPYMSRFRFLYGRQSTKFVEDNFYHIRAVTGSGGDTTVLEYESVGEDFSPVYYLGPPLLFPTF